MRFLADENFPRAAVEALAEAGHDVAWVTTISPGASDAQVLDRAVKERRILLTFDKDFGELVLHSKMPADCGVVLFRLPISGPKAVGRQLSQALANRDDWAGCFSVIEPGRVRMRPLA